MKCKNFFGKKICTFGSGAIETLPSKTTNPVPITIFTSKSCKMCNAITDQFSKRLRPIHNLVENTIVDIDVNSDKTPSEVLSLPTIKIGNRYLDAYISDKELVHEINYHLPKVE